jgi:hypothetical protein
VYEVLVQPASGSEFAEYTASPCSIRSRPKQRPAYSSALIGRLNCWCTPLLSTLWFCALLVLSGCGALVVSSSNAGSLVPQPSSVNFGAVSVGQTASTTVSFLNGSSAPVEVTQFNLTGQSFSVVGPSNLPVTIAAGGTYTLNVQFNPAVAGTATGQLTIASNSSTSGTPVISLSGTGTTGTGSAALSALSCSSGAMTGSGTDACTVTLTTSAPNGGLIVNLSSSNAAVTVPSTITVPEGAASAEFTATVSSVGAAQAVTMTANAGSVSKNFTLQLNAAILALSINATSVAFGDVVINTPATQSVTLTSSGTVPVTINGATLTGAGFTVSGPQFPATLSPGQAATLNIEFDPTAVGATTGQLNIASNSSTNGTAVIGLTGTGTATPVVAVSVTPSSASTTVGSTQQFAATVTGTSNTAVTWTASEIGCSGATCGTISSTGLYTAPAAAPSPATVSITATSVSDPSKSASASVTVLPPPGATYYLAPAADGGNDANSGLSQAAPWLTPNHAVNCGDVLQAAAGTYSYANFTSAKWGTVTCPAGNNVAWVKCATFDACKITVPSGVNYAAMDVSTSYWGVQGWEFSTSGGVYQTCLQIQPASGASSNIHHIIIANNVANGCEAGGIASANQGSVSTDYLVIIGNIAYGTSTGSELCYSGISVYQPLATDSLQGTHIYIAGNFSWDNVDPSTCSGGQSTDGEGITLDSLNDGQGGLTPVYNQQVVVQNNMTLWNGGDGINVAGSGNAYAPVYLKQNTSYGNLYAVNGNSWCGEISVDSSSLVQAFGNLTQTGAATGCYLGTTALYSYNVSRSTATIIVYNNFGYSAAGNNTTINSSNGFTTYGPNNTFGANPSFPNTAKPGAPSCGSASSVPNCMATVIANFTPTNAAAKSYGYHIPISTPVYDPLYPQWLCSVTNLPTGLVTPGCTQATSVD